MSVVKMIGSKNNLSQYKLSLPMARNVNTCVKTTSEVTKEEVSAFVLRAVDMPNKGQHHHKFQDSDPDVIMKILHGHPCPLGQGPFIHQIDHYQEQRYEWAPFTMFRHDIDQACFEWFPVEKNGWMINYVVKPITKKEYHLEGPASHLDLSIVYTCMLGKCIIHCCCVVCMDKSNNCRRSCKMDVCKECSSQCTAHIYFYI